jgi:excisionase family DNA binding protein
MEFLGVKEVAKFLEVSEKTVYNYITNGELQAYKIGDKWRVTQPAIEKFLESKSNIKKGEMTND